MKPSALQLPVGSTYKIVYKKLQASVFKHHLLRGSGKLGSTARLAHTFYFIQGITLRFVIIKAGPAMAWGLTGSHERDWML